MVELVRELELVIECGIECCEREIVPQVNRSVSCHSASRPAKKRGTPRHRPSELCIRGRCLHRRFFRVHINKI